MSRTEKDKPYWVLKEGESWRTKVGYPAARTGANTGASVSAKNYWGTERMKERRAAQYLEEAEPSRHRHKANWDYH